jgi:hypothetical protein
MAPSMCREPPPPELLLLLLLLLSAVLMDSLVSLHSPQPKALQAATRVA